MAPEAASHGIFMKRIIYMKLCRTGKPHQKVLVQFIKLERCMKTFLHYSIFLQCPSLGTVHILRLMTTIFILRLFWGLSDHPLQIMVLSRNLQVPEPAEDSRKN